MAEEEIVRSFWYICKLCGKDLPVATEIMLLPYHYVGEGAAQENPDELIACQASDKNADEFGERRDESEYNYKVKRYPRIPE